MTDPATPASAGVAAAPTGPVARMLWLAAGIVSVGLGAIGIIVPGFPTTVFFIVAAWCFSHGSPRFERWVLDLPKIGPLVRDHRDGLGMSKRVKIIANSMMWAAILVSCVLLRNHLWFLIAVPLVGVIGSLYMVFAVPSRERVLAERAAAALRAPDVDVSSI